MLLGGIQSFYLHLSDSAHMMSPMAPPFVMTPCRIELHLDTDKVQKVALLLVPRPDRADALGRLSGLLDGPLQINPGKAMIACWRRSHVFNVLAFVNTHAPHMDYRWFEELVPYKCILARWIDLSSLTWAPCSLALFALFTPLRWLVGRVTSVSLGRVLPSEQTAIRSWSTTTLKHALIFIGGTLGGMSDPCVMHGIKSMRSPCEFWNVWVQHIPAPVLRSLPRFR